MRIFFETSQHVFFERDTPINGMKTMTRKSRQRFCQRCGQFKDDSEWTGRDRRTRRLEGSAALCDPCRLQAWRGREWWPVQ